MKLVGLVMTSLFFLPFDQRKKKTAAATADGAAEAEDDDDDDDAADAAAEADELATQALVDPGPDVVICDEGHRIKNEKTAIAQVCLFLYAYCDVIRLILTLFSCPVPYSQPATVSEAHENSAPRRADRVG